MPDPIVVVGTGIAGATAALTLRAEGYDGPVVLIGDDPEAPYRRPPLSKEVLTGAQAPARTLLRPVGAWADQGIELRTGTEVTELDPAAAKITLADGSRIPYHRLLLATGGRPRNLPQARELDGVHRLRTLADARTLRTALLGARSLLVVGAGFIGLEAAAAARTLGLEVTVVETAATPVARALPPSLTDPLVTLHRENGVTLRTGIRLERLERRGAAMVATDHTGAELTADLVLVAVGIAPATGLAEAAGIAVDDGILVDEYGATSAPGVFAAGDVARRPDPVLGGRTRVEHWANAQDHGAAAARAMLGVREPFGPVPWYWTHQYGTTLQVCGHPSAADGMEVDGDLGGPEFTARLHRQGRLTAVVCRNRPADFRRLRPQVAAGSAPG